MKLCRKLDTQIRFRFRLKQSFRNARLVCLSPMLVTNVLDELKILPKVLDFVGCVLLDCVFGLVIKHRQREQGGSL